MAKKSISKIILGFLITLLLFSCSTEENITESSTNQDVEKVKKWFESDLNTTKLKIIEYTKDIQWDKAIITNGEKGQIIEVPITLLDFVTTTNTSAKKLTDHHRLLFIKGENKTYKYYDLQIFTSDSNFDNLDKNFNYYSIKDDFNGFVTIFDPVKQIVGSQKFKNGKIPKPNITAKEDAMAEENCTYLVWIYEDGSIDIITRLYCEAGGLTGGGPVRGAGGYGGGGTSGTGTNPPIIDYSVKNPCDKIKTLKEDPNYKNAVAALKENFKLQYETGYYISESNGYEAGTPVGNLQLSGKIHADTYGIIHVHEDDFTHQVNNGILRDEEVKPIHMFSPADVNKFSSLLINANKHQTPLDKVFIEMVSSSGRYQLRFEGDINNVKNFDYESMNTTYSSYMDKYSNNLDTGLLMFISEQIGIDGITLFKMNNDGSTDRKTLSSPNVLATNPC